MYLLLKLQAQQCYATPLLETSLPLASEPPCRAHARLTAQPAQVRQRCDRQAWLRAAPAERGKIKVKTMMSLGNVAVGGDARADATLDARRGRQARLSSSRNETLLEEEDDEDDNFSLDTSTTKRSGATAWEEYDSLSLHLSAPASR